MQEREKRRAERNDAHQRNARSAPWWEAVSAAVARRRDSDDVRLQYPQGVRPLHEVLRWPTVLSFAASALLGEPTPPSILVWDKALVTGTNRWVANEILEECGFSERIPMVEVRDAGIEPLVAMMFDRGFGSAVIQDAAHYALGWGGVDRVFWGEIMPGLLRGAPPGARHPCCRPGPLSAERRSTAPRTASRAHAGSSNDPGHSPNAPGPRPAHARTEPTPRSPGDRPRSSTLASPNPP